METARYLIVNADDFGASSGTNRGVIQAFESGIVTSASLMTRHPAAPEAAVYCREHTGLALGLHFDAGEWEYRDGEWIELDRAVELDDPLEIEAELERQLERFRLLAGRDPTHLDSHQHVHRKEPIRAVMLRLAEGLGIPLRECSGRVHYDGRFYGQSAHGAAWPEGISVAGLERTLSSLPAGITELGCHSGLDPHLNSRYCRERKIEVEALTDARARAALEQNGITLTSFHEIAALVTSPGASGPWYLVSPGDTSDACGINRSR